MDNAIKATEKTNTINNKWITSFTIVYLVIMLMCMVYCGIVSRNIKNTTIINSTNTTTTMQWSSDTSWTKW